MKILLDLGFCEWPPSGIGHATTGLYDACVRLDPSLKIEGIYRKSLQCELPEFLGAHRWTRWIPRRYLPLWRSVALPYFVNRTHPDFVHFPANKGTVPFYQGSRTILSIHDVIPLALPGLYFRNKMEEMFYRWTSKQSARYADLIITVSEYSKRDIYRHLGCRAEILVVPNANSLKLPATNSDSLQTSQEDHYLYYGGYDPRKGMEGLVKTFHELFTAGLVKIPLIIVGKPVYKYMPGLKEKIRAAYQDGAVSETGAVSDSELVQLIRRARALIYPSRYEGFGLPPLEAMSLGCPVITTRATSIPEVCGDAVLYATPDEKQDLAKAILDMENNVHLRQDLRFRGIEQAKKFTWEKSATVYLDALYRLLSQGTRQGRH